MEPADRLWKEVLRLGRDTPAKAVGGVTAECLTLTLPWNSRLAGVAGVLHQVIGLDSGVSVYGAQRPVADLVLLASAGRMGPLRVAWGAPLAGLAARERAVQFVGEGRVFPDYLGGWLGVVGCIAVPIMRDRQVFAVLEIRSHEAERLGLFDAEIVLAAAEQLADKWANGDQ